MADVENVIIIGSGPAGYTAALYTARANLNPLVIEGFLWGGLLQQTTEVENYPGFPGGGIAGPELMQKLRDQAEDFGTRFLTDQATSVKLADEPGGIHEVHVGADVYRARTVILSMGAEHVIMVVGGGDSAMEEAMFLAKFGSKVLLVHRRDEFRASKIMEGRARGMDNIEFKTPYVVEAFLEGDGPFKRVARLKKTGTDETEDIEIGGAFIAIGHEPQSEIVDGAIEVDDEGYVKVDGRSTRTNRPGVFAAGDLVDHTYRQAVTAAGSGCQAALDAEWYLRDTPQIETPPSLAEGDLAEAQWAPAAQVAK
jgi:thioredoxin reductase (NADPH)